MGFDTRDKDDLLAAKGDTKNITQENGFFQTSPDNPATIPGKWILIVGGFVLLGVFAIGFMTGVLAN